MNEININRKIDHPNIIKYVEYFDLGDLIAIVMEYSPNGDLLTYFNRIYYSQRENAFIQNNLSLDRRKIFAFHPKNLRKKGKTRKRLGNGGRFTTGKSIRKRDKSVYNRKGKKPIESESRNIKKEPGVN